MLEGLVMIAYLAVVGLCFLGLPLLALFILYLVVARGLGWPPFRKNGIAIS